MFVRPISIYMSHQYSKIKSEPHVNQVSKARGARHRANESKFSEKKIFGEIETVFCGQRQIIRSFTKLFAGQCDHSIIAWIRVCLLRENEHGLTVF